MQEVAGEVTAPTNSWLAPLANPWATTSLAAIALYAVLSAGAKMNGQRSLFTFLMVHHRWVFAVPLGLVSVIYNAIFYVRNWIAVTLRAAPKQHAARVAKVQAQVAAWAERKDGTRLCTARPGYLTTSLRIGKYKHSPKYTKISVPLHDVIGIDEERRTVRVEPLVTMGQVSATLLREGWTLAVLPELDDLTVGGLICGCGVETSSHVHGMVQSTIASVEVVVADGSVVTATPTNEHSDLFFSLPWSHGTLGFLVGAELRIVPAKSHVRLTYSPHHSREDFIREFTAASCRGTRVDPASEFHVKDGARPHSFVEGLMYSQQSGVVMTAELSDLPPSAARDGPENKIGRWYKPWFYKHVETILGRGEKVVEYIPLRDYYVRSRFAQHTLSHILTLRMSQHRHTTAIFWEMEQIVPFGNHPLFRWLLGWAFPPKVSLLKLTQTAEIKELYKKNHVVQDLLVPISEMDRALSAVDEHFGVFPLWLCPMLLPKEPERGFIGPPGTRADAADASAAPEGAMFVDIGACKSRTD